MNPFLVGPTLPACASPDAPFETHEMVVVPATIADGRYPKGTTKRACVACGWVEPGTLRIPCAVEDCTREAVTRFHLCEEHGSGRIAHKTCGHGAIIKGRLFRTPPCFCWRLVDLVKGQCSEHRSKKGRVHA